MFFDTHCHLNFQVFAGRVEEVIAEAKKAGVSHIVVPGTDIETSKKAVEIAEKYDGVYAAVGIHPHHVYQINQKRSAESEKIRNQKNSDRSDISDYSGLSEIEKLLISNKVVAVGEVGLDKHEYKKTVYNVHKVYKVHKEFIELQKEFFVEQIKLAHKYKKALIIHNREAKKEILEILTHHSSLITYHSVFHCCEPDEKLLEFAKKHKMFIGIDGDINYRKDKQEFIKKIPLELLVLETDSPYLSPERKFPNEPKNIKIIAEFIAKLINTSIKRLIKVTTKNARKLFFNN